MAGAPLPTWEKLGESSLHLFLLVLLHPFLCQFLSFGCLGSGHLSFPKFFYVHTPITSFSRNTKPFIGFDKVFGYTLSLAAESRVRINDQPANINL